MDSNYGNYMNNDFAQSIAPKMKKKFYERAEGGLRSIDGSKIYFVGIIDILTPYSLKKRAEHTIRSIQYDSQTISCIPPEPYSQRFIEFMDKSLC